MNTSSRKVNLFEIAIKQVEIAAEKLKLDEGILAILKNPRKLIEVSLPVKMDDGSIKVFKGYRGSVQPIEGALQGRYKVSSSCRSGRS
jgi:glutamate dehydrogenase